MHAEPAPPSSGPDRVVQALEAEITGLSPGAPLPSVRDLCAQHEVAGISLYHLGLLPWRTLERAAAILR